MSEGIVYILLVLWVFTFSFCAARLLFWRDASVPEWRPEPVRLTSFGFRTGLGANVIFGLCYVYLLKATGVFAVEGVSWWTQLLLINQFAGPLAVGLLLGAGRLSRLDRWYVPLVLLPALVTSILYTGRTAFFGPAVILATGYLCGTVLLRPLQTPLLSLKRVGLVSVCLVLSALYGTAIYVLRMARGEAEFQSVKEQLIVFEDSFDIYAWQSSYERIRSHLYGQPSTFSLVYRYHYSQPSFSPSWGRFMFAGPLVLFGIERTSHENFLTSDNVETNVYTIFAPPIEDFGIGGSFLWWVVLGVVSAAAYRAAQENRLSGAAIVSILLMNFQNGCCFLFRYNSVIGAYIAVVGVMSWLDHRPVAGPKVVFQPIGAEKGKRPAIRRWGKPRPS